MVGCDGWYGVKCVEFLWSGDDGFQYLIMVGLGVDGVVGIQCSQCIVGFYVGNYGCCVGRKSGGGWCDRNDGL